MTNTPNQKLYLPPGQVISNAVLDEMRVMNAGKLNHDKYKRKVRDLFGLSPENVDIKKKFFLAGFIEGEGSISIGAKKNHNARFGVELDPLFNITQHLNGVQHLYLALEVFQTGRLRYKAGSNATLVFIIEPRKSLQEKFCPFYEQYVYPLSCPTKQRRYHSFKKMLDLFDQNAHLDRQKMIDDVLPIWDAMRMQTGYAGQTLTSLQDAQDFVRNYKKPN